MSANFVDRSTNAEKLAMLQAMDSMCETLLEANDSVSKEQLVSFHKCCLMFLDKFYGTNNGIQANAIIDAIVMDFDEMTKERQEALEIVWGPNIFSALEMCHSTAVQSPMMYYKVIYLEYAKILRPVISSIQRHVELRSMH